MLLLLWRCGGGAIFNKNNKIRRRNKKKRKKGKKKKEMSERTEKIKITFSTYKYLIKYYTLYNEVLFR